MPVKPNREYRTMSLVTPKTEGKRIDTNHYVEGYATTYGRSLIHI